MSEQNFLRKILSLRSNTIVGESKNSVIVNNQVIPNDWQEYIFKKWILDSAYLNARRKTMSFPGVSKEHKYLCTSELMPIIMLPLIKKALLTQSHLFFIERGCYMLKCAADLVLKQLCLEGNLKIYSYKIAQGGFADAPIKELIATALGNFLSINIPKQRAQKLTSGQINLELMPLLKQFPEDKKTQFIANILKNNPKFQSFENIANAIPVIRLLQEILKAEPNEIYLDITKGVTKAHRACEGLGIIKRFRDGQRPALITRDTFGLKPPKSAEEARFRDYVFKKAKKSFPNGLNSDQDLEDYFVFYQTEVQAYCYEKAKSFHYATKPLMRYLTKQLNIDLDKVIYCDDGVGTGNSYHQAHLFHQIFSDKPFAFNRFTIDYPQDQKNKYLPMSFITTSMQYPEDVAEFFPGYYDEKLSRIMFQDLVKPVSSNEHKLYQQFLPEIDRMISTNAELKTVFQDKIITNTLDFIKDHQEKHVAKRHIALFLLDETNVLNQELVQYIGHNILKNRLIKLIKQLSLHSSELFKRYTEIKPIHDKITINLLLDRHKYALQKQMLSSNYFNNNREMLLNYLNKKADIKQNEPVSELVDKSFHHIFQDYLHYLGNIKVIEKRI